MADENQENQAETQGTATQEEQTSGQTPPVSQDHTSEAVAATTQEPAPVATETHAETAPPAPVDPVPPVAAPEPVAAPPAPDVVKMADPVVKEDAQSTVTATQIVDGDDENIVSLKLKLQAFKDALTRPGRGEDNYADVAKLAASFTKLLIQHPKDAMFNTLLDFFKENIDGVCSAKCYLKGLSTLSGLEQRQVGFLFNMFSEIALGNVISYSSGAITSVLLKPEFVSFHQRKMAVLRQAKA